MLALPPNEVLSQLQFCRANFARMFANGLVLPSSLYGAGQLAVPIHCFCPSFCDGDAQAFEELMLRYQNRLMSLLAHLIGQRDLAEDLTQDIFLKIFKSLDTFDRRANFQTWLISVSRNLCIDH